MTPRLLRIHSPRSSAKEAIAWSKIGWTMVSVFGVGCDGWRICRILEIRGRRVLSGEKKWGGEGAPGLAFSKFPRPNAITRCAACGELTALKQGSRVEYPSHPLFRNLREQLGHPQEPDLNQFRLHAKGQRQLNSPPPPPPPSPPAARPTRAT